ncbi:hypothetical protein RLEG3_18655 [Rhizobium leguminosarum bv. trifolii WSM1689]|uniref:hypothetical protein n=1 Tax=Rhizobium leguminosarum TaxID=384 RepID=UPI0003E0B372|nr:hypothetical protein [Rhizobium leguminosarum]AHF83715.1 hypothetical protein RLEG3_18655 [Rhizobium leguminosarum bv. trifolii WSM1689]RWY85159.1 hypothetical protein EHI44_16725 [Rhizobium leguminosarum]
MTFSHAARILAYLILLVGAWQVVIGLVIANELLLPYEEALRRYTPGAPSSGSVIDKGIYKLVVAVGLGTLAEISFRLLKMRREQ